MNDWLKKVFRVKDRKLIITPYPFSDNWTPPEEYPPWSIPDKSECTVPPTIREVGIERVLNRKVVEVCCHLGTYGMGGVGLCGFTLEANTFPEETLVLCVWGAASWLHWDDLIIDNPKTTGKWGEPSNTQHGYRKFEKEAQDTTLREFHLNDTNCLLAFDDHKLELKESPLSRPVFATGEGRVWNPAESLKDAWFVSPTWRIGV